MKTIICEISRVEIVSSTHSLLLYLLSGLMHHFEDNALQKNGMLELCSNIFTAGPDHRFKILKINYFVALKR